MEAIRLIPQVHFRNRVPPGSSGPIVVRLAFGGHGPLTISRRLHKWKELRARTFRFFNIHVNFHMGTIYQASLVSTVQTGFLPACNRAVFLISSLARIVFHSSLLCCLLRHHHCLNLSPFSSQAQTRVLKITFQY